MWVGGALAATTLLGAASCTHSSDVPSKTSGDAQSVDVYDGGAFDSASPPFLLVAGDVNLLGATTDNYFAYRFFDPTSFKSRFEVVTVDGSPPIVLSPDMGSYFYVKTIQKAVAFWTASSAIQLGTFNVWTHDYGSKSVTGTTSYTNFFGASPANDAIVFASSVADGGMVDGSVLSVNLTLASPADVNGPELVHDVNVAALLECPVQLRFTDAGQTFLAHCTGHEATASAGRLVMAKRDRAGAWSNVTLANEGDGTAILPSQSIDVDGLGTKAFAMAALPVSEGRLIDVDGGATSAVAEDVTAGFLSPDGGALYYVAGGAIHRAATESPDSGAVLVNGVDHLLAVSDDRRVVAFSSRAGTQADINVVDLESGEAPLVRSVDASAVASAVISTSGRTVEFITVDPKRNRCHYFPSDGGEVRSFGENVVFCGIPSGSEVAVYGDGLHEYGPFNTFDLYMVDLTRSDSQPVLLDSEVQSILGGTGGVVGYAKRGPQSGLYARKLP